MTRAARQLLARSTATMHRLSALRASGGRCELLLKVTPKASRVAGFIVLWALAMKDEGKDAYTISEYQRYYNENERQAYRRSGGVPRAVAGVRDAERAGAADRPAPSRQGRRDEAAVVGRW